MAEIRQDPDLKNYTLDRLPVLKKLKEEYLNTPTAVCIERAEWITKYMTQLRPQDEPMELTRAKAVSHYLSSRKPLFHDDNPIAGATTSKPLGAPVYPEVTTGLSIWPELDTISTRKANPQQLTKEEAETLNFDVYPHWMEGTILEVTRKRVMAEQNTICQLGLKLFDKFAFFVAAKAGGISHTIPRYEDVLHKGLNALIAEARQKEEALKQEPAGADIQDKIIFYQAMQTAMQGIIAYAQNLATKAKMSAMSAMFPEKKKYFEEIAEVCSRVPAQPAQNFREAVNALWLCHVGVLAENVNMAVSPGRLDQVLFPFFKKDAEQNKITIEEALTLIGGLWFKISDNTNLVPETAERMWGGAGSVPAVTLGGIDQDGNDAVNDLTYLMLRVTELLVIKDPNVNARYYPGKNDTDYRDRVSRVIINTRAIPAVYNDIVNIATLENQGVSPESARDYGVVGCVELSSAGREYTSSSSILFNLTSAMDMVLYNGKRPYLTGALQIGPETGEPDQLKTFDQFQTAFEAQLKALLEIAIALNEELAKTHQQMFQTPLLSALFSGPMEKGKDLIFGGAQYNSSGVTHIGFADVCDSLNAVEAAVYNDKITTLKELRDAIDANFKGYERLHEYLKNKAPKYGNDDSGSPNPIAVKNSQRLIKFLYDLYQQHINYRGGKYRPAFWTMTNHAGLGKIGQALPSGRKANEVFSSGITPASQSAQDLTGAYKSVAELNSLFIPGGVALNMKYTPEPSASGNGKYLKYFTDLLESYFKYGGMQVQFNIQSYETLLDAKDHPEKYPGLIVRVSGYSAYFKDLNEAMKIELITRTQYDPGSGKAVPFTMPEASEGGK
jgi:formate C-acetyltransferase